MVDFSSVALSPKGVNCESSKPCICKLETAKGSAITDHLNPHFFNKRTLMKYKRGTRPCVFRGKEASLNYAILFVLSRNTPLAIWSMLVEIRSLPGFKHLKYAVLWARVKDLETHGHIEIKGTRDKKQGGQTNLYAVTLRAQLAMALIGKTVDDIINQLNEEVALVMLRAISK